MSRPTSFIPGESLAVPVWALAEMEPALGRLRERIDRGRPLYAVLIDIRATVARAGPLRSPAPERALTVQEVAILKRCNDRTVRRAIERGELDAHHRRPGGHHWFIWPRDADGWTPGPRRA